MKKIYFVGIGMGNIETLTEQGKKAVAASELLIGAERMINSFPDFQGVISYAVSSDRIMDVISEYGSFETAAVVFSGDTGFYSGAKKLNETIEEKKQQGDSFWKNCEVEFLPGISSLQYFSAKLKIPWEDTKILSLHGREGNIAGTVWNYERIFVLTGGGYSVQKICSVLAEEGLQDAVVHVGERLSYSNERIVTDLAGNLTETEFDALAVMIVENNKVMKQESAVHGIKDECFLRGNVPMTKREIRSISLSKLQLKSDDIVYDIGAGTGSVSVEMAQRANSGTVYAIECNEEAIGLIKANAEKFGAWNLKVVPGKAPEALSDLPSPNCAFIGGSKGNLAEILESLVEKNPKIRVVINAITLETVSEALNQFKRMGFSDTDIVQVFVAQGKAMGEYHLMQGQNPVFIMSGRME